MLALFLAMATTVTLPDGSKVSAETAHSAEERSAVLRDRPGIDPDGAILLEFPESGEQTFPAEAMRSSLDLAFLDASGKITSLQTYGVNVDSIGQGKYILALNLGSIEQHGLKTGQRLKISSGKRKKKALSDDEQKARDDAEGKKPDPDQVNRDMMQSLEGLKGKVPDAMYQQMLQQAQQAGAMMKADPNADTMDILKTVTGMDMKKVAARAEAMKKKDPKLTDEEVARLVAAEMMKDLPKPETVPTKP